MIPLKIAMWWSIEGPRDTREVGEEIKEKDLQSELVAYIHDLYFNPRDEKVLAPPMTAKRCEYKDF